MEATGRDERRKELECGGCNGREQGRDGDDRLDRSIDSQNGILDVIIRQRMVTEGRRHGCNGGPSFGVRARIQWWWTEEQEGGRQATEGLEDDGVPKQETQEEEDNDVWDQVLNREKENAANAHILDRNTTTIYLKRISDQKYKPQT